MHFSILNLENETLKDETGFFFKPENGLQEDYIEIHDVNKQSLYS